MLMAVVPAGTLADTPEDQASRLILFLNKQTGRNYRSTVTNRRYIIERMREGYTEQDCRQVIAMKCKEWTGQVWHSLDGRQRRADDYLNPISLFRADNFNRYAGMLG